MATREKYLEAELVAFVRECKGKCIKLKDYIGIPDRLILLPGSVCPVCQRGGHIDFSELKADGGKLTAAQERWAAQLRTMGFRTHQTIGRAGLNKLYEHLRGIIQYEQSKNIRLDNGDAEHRQPECEEVLSENELV
jgi:hypothetical protein